MEIPLSLPYDLAALKGIHCEAQAQRMQKNREHAIDRGVPETCLYCEHGYVNDMDVFVCWDECKEEVS